MSNGLHGSWETRWSIMLLMLCVSCAQHRTLGTSATASCPVEWTSPQLLEHDGGKPVAILGGFAALVNDRRSMMSAFSAYWLERDRVADTSQMRDTTYFQSKIRLLTSVGGVVDDLRAVQHIDAPDAPLPNGRGVPIYSFQLAGWSRNSVRVAWLASDSGPSSNGSTKMTRLEVATFDGRTWTDRSRVPVVPTTHSFIVPARRAGRAWQTRAFAILMSPPGIVPYVSVLVQTKSTWVVTRMDTTQFVFAPSLAELPDGTLVLTRLATFNNVRGWYSQRGAVRGDGMMWEAPVLIDRVPGGTGPYTWAHLGGDSLMLAWHRERSDSSQVGIRVAITPDGGTSWSAGNVDALSSSAGGLVSLAVDVTGTPRLMFMTDGDDASLSSPGRLSIASWVNGRWSTPQPIASDVTDGAQQLWALADGTLLASWLKIHAYSERGIAAKTLVAVGRARCSR